MEKVMVIGASPNPTRYSYKAVEALIRNNYHVVPVGPRKGCVAGQEIINSLPELHDVRTVILYINIDNQKAYYNYILNMNPTEILFNPGTENEEFAQLARERGILVRYECALVLIDQGLL